MWAPMMFFGAFAATDDMCLVQTAFAAPASMNESQTAYQLQTRSSDTDNVSQDSGSRCILSLTGVGLICVMLFHFDQF